MKRALTAAMLAAVLAVAGCSSSAPVSAPAGPAAATQSAPASPAAPVYDNTTACAAFTEATTSGVPAADAGEDTMTWLQSQTASASPALQGQIGAFVAAWQDTPPDQAAISQATRRIERICAS